jgi:hypothetical protein
VKAPAYAVAHAFTSPNTLIECKIVTLLSTYAHFSEAGCLRGSQNSLTLASIDTLILRRV